MKMEPRHTQNVSKGTSFVPGRILAMGLMGLVLIAGCSKKAETPAHRQGLRSPLLPSRRHV